MTWPRPFQGRFVICRLGLAMFNPIKFEMSAITSNEEIKSKAKCKNSRFEPPFGGLRGNAQVYLWLDGKRVVLLAIIELFSIALTAAALLSEICRNRRFSEEVGHFKRKFQIDGDVARNPPMDC